MIYTDYRKNDLYTTIKIMLEDGYTVGEILEVIGSATDDFFG